MARVEPGLYEPSDDVRVFDGAEDDYDDEGSRLPLLIVIALLVLAAFAGVVWLAYTQGVQRGRQDVPRVIAAETGPVKTAPGEPTGAANPYRGLKIYNNKAPADTQANNGAPLPSIITQPGEPLFSAFGPKHPAPGQANRPAAAMPPAPTVVAQTPPPAPVNVAPAPMAAPAPQPPVQKVVAAPPPKPAPVVVKPAPAPVVTKPVPVVATNVVPPPMASAASGGAYVAQIGAFKSQAEAETGWAAFKRNHAATLGGMSPSIVSVDLGEKGTWYRLRTGGFADKAGAADFCAKLKAEGGSCLPAKG